MTFKEKIKNSALSLQDDLVKFVRDIIAIPSVSTKEKHAHTPDDQVKIADLVTAVQFYVSFVLHY